VNDPWGGSAGCLTLTGDENKAARAWYMQNPVSVLAYSSLGRGLFSGKVRSDEIEKARAMMEPGAAHAYCHEENFERLKRAEMLAEKKACSVSQIALAWLLKQKIEAFPIVSASTGGRMEENVKAMGIELCEDEAKWLNLE
jgi:aryl-alcohol dehydrogenase-like predicted oxidoreductase